jgi:hypothetical protein
MKRTVPWVCAALLCLTGCFEPLVGSPCADNQSPCGAVCKARGACALDGGMDTERLDWGPGEAGTESDGAAGPLDTGAFDLGLALDEGYDGTAGAVDVDNGEAFPSIDLGRAPDRPTDPAADRGLADRQDVAAKDVRLADASDGRAADAARDTRDAAAPDTRDVPLLAAEDAADGPRPEPEVKADTADSSGCLNCNPPGDALDTARDAVDALDGRLDVGGSEPGPEAQPACPGLQVKCSGVCVDLQSNQANCGLCGYGCSPLPCIDGLCQTCPAGQTLCNTQCIDTSTNAAHCGGCGQTCASGACRFGACKTSTAGHIVVIGHDFQTSNAAMNRILGNAIFLPGSADVNVVEYVGIADSTAVSNSHVAITQVANTLGRNAIFFSDVSFSPSSLAARLESADVFLIQSQTLATNTILAELGNSWASVLGTFVHTGGIVVALDGSYPINLGTSQMLAQARLMSIATVGTVTNETCSITTATDPVATSVPATYSCLQNSAVFSGEGTHVVEDLGRPVVLHVAF